MSLGPVMIDIEGTALSPADRSLLRHPAVGGLILFARNYSDPDQLIELCRSVRALRSPELLIAVDQEGGRVQRFLDGFTALPPMRALGHRYQADRQQAVALARQAGWLLGTEIASVGVDFSFAPVLDLDWGVSEVIGDRAFDRKPEVVAELGLAVMRGLRDAGVAAIAKHFPGHGAVVADSHVALPNDRRELADILEDIRPFERLIDDGLGGIMSAHVVYSNCDRLPASLSHWWLTDYLRRRLGFDGAIFSDDLTMKAAREFGTLTETATLALRAGSDMVLVCNDRGGAERVVEAVAGWTHPPSMVRLAALRARAQIAYAELRSASQWQDACAKVASLSERPALDLNA